ncbi:hypothetical protein CYLTODRAFT_419555 [Cylindrobasidium torrendii FP15055 ss-10]|uniref:Uncharacterized protein n=1 Tax=Cylindrobasidium torrendii FP15055 ss-10 TaxID=1314674 RepID=A0A0D7BMC0_9AGAR|nr:hypothetical protein CYLTODRAFT_419555 [Cylindrobasidium torrendii FP15055 ss-10]
MSSPSTRESRKPQLQVDLSFMSGLPESAGYAMPPNTPTDCVSPPLSKAFCVIPLIYVSPHNTEDTAGFNAKQARA